MGQNNNSLLKFNNIWDQDYHYENSDKINLFMIESNAYIRNAYHKFKNHNNY